MEKTPLKHFSFSTQRYVKGILIFLLLSFSVFYLTGFTQDLTAWQLPLLFVGTIFLASGLYAWATRNRESISVYDGGMQLGASYVPWEDVEDVTLKRSDIDTISYTLCVLLKDKSKLDRDVNFFQEPATDVFHFVNQTFRKFKGEL